MAKYIASRGDSFIVSVLDRAFGGRERDVLRIEGGSAANAVTGTAATTLGDINVTPPSGSRLKLNGNQILAGAPFLSAMIAGSATAAAVTLTGAVVGDKVVMVQDLTTPANVASSFESTITVADSIAQTGTGLNGKNILVLLVKQTQPS